MHTKRTFNDIFNRVIIEWPTEISLEGDGIPSLTAEGHNFRKLSEAWNSAEQKFPDQGSFEALMVWSIFGVLHRHAMRLARDGETLLELNTVPKSEFEEEFWQDLHEEDWVELLPYYSRDES